MIKPALPSSGLTWKFQLTVLLVGLVGAWVVLGYTSFNYFQSAERVELRNRLILYQRNLVDTIDRFQHLPFVLARDGGVINSNGDSDPISLSSRFAQFAEQAKLEAIYLMNGDGLVIASSNHNQTPTFMGKNYGFRPYFKSALSGARGEYFGVGATTSRPGYFVAEPVRQAGQPPHAVIAIKLDMTEFQKSWEASNETVLVTNAEGIVLISSDANWLYKTITPLNPERLAALRQSRQFGTHPISRLDWQPEGPDKTALEGATLLHVSSTIERLGWTVHYLASQDRVYERTAFSLFVYVIIVSVLFAVFTMMRTARTRSALEASQADRQKLRATNLALEHAQKELARNSKLAALGQLAASVTHELGQPISALRNHLTALQIGGNGTSDQAIGQLNKIVDRMASVTDQLRFFAQQRDGRSERFVIQGMLKDAQLLFQHDIRAAKVELSVALPEKPVEVLGDRLRLERAVVNLVKNATRAMQDSSVRKLALEVTSDENHAKIVVSDTGDGLRGLTIDELQEPFRTTRPSGEGMGLGLSIASEIVQEHDGSLSATERSGGGAEFVITLPLNQKGKPQEPDGEA